MRDACCYCPRHSRPRVVVIDFVASEGDGPVLLVFCLTAVSVEFGCKARRRPAICRIAVGDGVCRPLTKRKTTVSSYSRFLNVYRNCEDFRFTWQVLLGVRGERNVARLVSGRVRFCAGVELQALQV